MSGSCNPQVIMLSREVNSYRVGFFEASRDLLDRHDIDFRVLLGGSTAADRSKNDRSVLDWAQQVKTRNFQIRGNEVWWQSCLREAVAADLVITEQATKQLLNLPLSLLQRAGRAQHCLWGHGRNFQLSIEGGSGESIKNWFTRPAHWFFSYTEASTAALLDAEFPADRITTFNNSTDVAAARETLSALPENNESLIRSELNMTSGPVVGYIGGLTTAKRVPFLVEAFDELRRLCPNVNVVVIGAGSEADVVHKAAESRGWIHPLGAMYGADRIRYGSICSVLLMPGLVGLNVVDGFALGLPTFTTDVDFHSPEISYLQHGKNGWISPASASPRDFADDVAGVLEEPELLRSLQQNAWDAGEGLGIERMAELFVEGVLAALAAPRRKQNLPALLQRRTSR